MATPAPDPVQPLGKPLTLPGTPQELKEILESLSLPGEDWSQVRWPPPLEHLDLPALAAAAIRLNTLRHTLDDLQLAIRDGLEAHLPNQPQ